MHQPNSKGILLCGLGAGLALTLILVSFRLNASSSVGKLEGQLMKVSHVAEWAVLPIERNVGGEKPIEGVVGTGFLINDEGYFVTAAHVLSRNIAEYNVALRVPENLGQWGESFDVVGKDSRLDIALCRIKGFDSLARMHPKPPPGVPHVNPPRYATLKLSNEPVRLGQFVVVAGFPLFSELPMVQFGNVAAAKTFTLLSPMYAPDQFEVSVAASGGDSGGPVIDLDTGRVVGVMVEGSFRTKDQVLGLAIAAPAKWVGEILEKNGVQSQYKAPGPLFRMGSR
jgi:S1-C subfamily serine protease